MKEKEMISEKASTEVKDIAQTLQHTFDEEAAMDKKLTVIAEKLSLLQKRLLEISKLGNKQRKIIMPQTIDKTFSGQIIGGIFSNEENAEKAVEAFEELEISSDDIEVIVQLEGEQPEDVYIDILSDRGFSESQALYYGKVIHEGKVLVVVSEVIDPAPVIDIFNDYKAEYNPNGSRNLREDVAIMTMGAIAGASAGGVAGAVIGGPIGAVAGVAAGAVVGGDAGAVAGKAIEHRK